MNIFDALVLGTVQGLTEFLPISSSGHLILAQSLLGLEVAELKSFDVFVHFGTLMAILFYFRQDFWQMFLSLIPGTPKDAAMIQERRLLVKIIFASIPAGLVGILWEDQIDLLFRSSFSVVLWMLVTAIFFILMERVGKDSKQNNPNFSQAMLIGFAQAVALIPGVSRSGSTISTALGLGLKRDQAARFSFLLGSPAIFGAGLITAMKLMKGSEVFVGWSVYLAGFLASAIVGYWCISVLMKYLKSHTLKPFAAYLLVLSGSVILYHLLS